MKALSLFFALAVCLGFSALSHLSLADMPIRATPSDRVFIKEAASGGNDEIALSKIAVRRSSSPMIRMFARTMIRQHSQANAQLKLIAMSLGVRVPRGPDFSHRLIEMKLDMMTGAAFNRAYINAMVKDHTAADHVFQMGTTVDSNELRSFALNTLPVVENHLKMATDIQAGESMSKMAHM